MCINRSSILHLYSTPNWKFFILLSLESSIVHTNNHVRVLYWQESYRLCTTSPTTSLTLPFFSCFALLHHTSPKPAYQRSWAEVENGIKSKTYSDVLLDVKNYDPGPTFSSHFASHFSPHNWVSILVLISKEGVSATCWRAVSLCSHTGHWFLGWSAWYCA
jgi:hypothetical protein